MDQSPKWFLLGMFFANNSQYSYLTALYWIWTMAVIEAIAASGPFY